ncbi:MAG: hypothetical protein IJM59_01860, partial [Proteobacteria bacterium]|nr:hypothetical protein [Pseudomonadota bacterium]
VHNRLLISSLLPIGNRLMISLCLLGSASFTVHRTLKLSAPNARFLMLSQLRGECPSMDMPPSPLAAVHGGVVMEMNANHSYSKSLQ